MTQDGEPQAKRVKESGDNEEKKLQEEEGNYDSELLEAAKVFFSSLFGNRHQSISLSTKFSWISRMNHLTRLVLKYF